MKIEWVGRKKEQYHFLMHHFHLFFGEEEYLADNSFFCLTIVVDTMLCAVSIIRYNEEERSVLLCYTFVDSQYRRRGYNTLIKQEVETFAQLKGAHKIIGHVREQNEASYNSLQKSGFVVDGGEELFYKNGDRKIRMVKYLTPSE